MKDLNNETLLLVKGGGVSVTLINAVARLITTVLNLGQTVGSAIRRVMTGSSC